MYFSLRTSDIHRVTSVVGDQQRLRIDRIARIRCQKRGAMGVQSSRMLPAAMWLPAETVLLRRETAS